MIWRPKKIFSQIIEGLIYLHSINIYHRDIKLENIIIDENLNVKLIDFGFGVNCDKHKLLNFFCGTPSYMPPEICTKKDYVGASADIWSAGILLYTFLCGNFPFKGLTEKELYSKIAKGIFTVPTYVCNDTCILIKKILVVNPSRRLTAEEVKLHLKNVFINTNI